MTVAGFVLLAQLVAFFSVDQSAVVLVRVNGTAITAGDVDFAATQQGLSKEERPQADPKLIEQLVERQLIRAFLASQKVQPIADELQYQIDRAEELIRKRGEDPKKLLAKLGYTPDRLKSELGLPLAWKIYARQTITDQQIKEYFGQHRQELDGTQLRGSQIFLKLSKPQSESELAEKKEKLSNLRREILAGTTSFAGAAKAHSEAPTRENGGDLGLFGWRGKLPGTVSQAAFGLKVNEISDPIVSPFGVHLIQVTERHPGDFSLEDVRPVIMETLSQQLWKTTVEKQRSTAKIERP